MERQQLTGRVRHQDRFSDKAPSGRRWTEAVVPSAKWVEKQRFDGVCWRVDMTKDEIEQGLEDVRREYGPWLSHFPLPHGTWTGDPAASLPHTRLRRFVQTMSDLVGKPLSECRILDLACLEGMFALECALQGAEVMAVEIRPAHVAKARFAARAYGLSNLTVVQGDVRTNPPVTDGGFDVVLCSGLLYHLGAEDAIGLVGRMYELTNRILLIDTELSLQPTTQVVHAGERYFGETYQEHEPKDDGRTKLARVYASLGNDESFWFTRPSLINLLGRVGFSSVYECFNPPHLNYGRPGLERDCRCTFVAVKGAPVTLQTTPSVNALQESWPEGTLTYDARKAKRFSYWRSLARLLGR